MKTTILSLLIVTAFTCQSIKTSAFSGFDVIKRCENDEVICYFAKMWNAGGMSCKFKDQSANASKKVGK